MTGRNAYSALLLATAMFLVVACKPNYPDDPQQTGCTAHLGPDQPDWQAKIADWQTELTQLQAFNTEASAEELRDALDRLEQLGQLAQTAAASKDVAFLCVNEDGSTNEALNGSEGARRRAEASRIASQAQTSGDTLLANYIQSRAGSDPQAGLVAANILVPLFPNAAGQATRAAVQEIDSAEQARLDAMTTVDEYAACKDGICACVFSRDPFESDPPYTLFFDAPTDIEIIWMRCFLDKRYRDYDADAGLRLEMRSHDSRSVGLHIEGQEPILTLLEPAQWEAHLDQFRKKKYVDIPLKLTGSTFTDVITQMNERSDSRRIVELTLYALVPEKGMDEPAIVPMSSGYMHLPEGILE